MARLRDIKRVCLSYSGDVPCGVEPGFKLFQVTLPKRGKDFMSLLTKKLTASLDWIYREQGNARLMRNKTSGEFESLEKFFQFFVAIINDARIPDEVVWARLIIGTRASLPTSQLCCMRCERRARYIAPKLHRLPFCGRACYESVKRVASEAE